MTPTVKPAPLAARAGGDAPGWPGPLLKATFLKAAFVKALRAEWTKLATLPGTFWLLASVVVATIAVSAAVSGGYQCAPGACAAARTGTDPAKVALAGLYLGQVLAAAVGVLAVGGEYDSQMIRVTLTAVPRRLAVLGAKAVMVTGLVLAASVVAIGGCYLAGRTLLPAHGLTAANGYVVLSLASGTDRRALLCAVLYLTLTALVALGISTAVRNSGAGIGIVLGLLFLFPILTAVIPDHTLARHLEQIGLMTAGGYSYTTVGVHSLPLAPWQGIGVVALWAVGSLLLGAAVLRFRDA